MAVTEAGRVVADNHHLVFPKSMYKKKRSLEKQFRDLPCLQIQIDKEVHNLIHSLYPKAVKASRAAMRHFVDRHARRECSCYRQELRAVWRVADE